MTDNNHNGGPQIDTSKGYSLIHNDWANHPLVGVHSEYFRFWVDLLMNCAYRDGSIRTIGGHVYELRAGELVGAISYLANRWGVTPKRVRTFVDKAAQWRLVTVTKRGTTQGTAKGTPAQTININNYNELYSSEAIKGHATGHDTGPEKGTPRARGGASQGHEYNTKNNINTKNTNTPLTPQRGNSDDFPSHVQPVTNWSTAFAQPDQDGFVFGGPQGVQLVNGTQQFWLEQFDGDQKALGLALIKAAASVQPNSKQNRVQQIVRMLSSEAAAKHNSDQRYAKAASKKAKSAKDVDIFAIMREMTGD